MSLPPAYWLGLCAVAVCAVTGVLEGGRKRIDLFGLTVVALATALGGGTLRDLLLDRPVFWVSDPAYLLVAMAASLATFVLARLYALPARWLLVPDALGLALFTVLGTQIALDHDVSWFVATLLGVITGVFGGVLRDVLCNEVPLVFTGELYATAAWIGALLLIVLYFLEVPRAPAMLAAVAVIFAVRMAGVRWRITLPTFTSRG
jgi:uncharacterized membrane protein YeiH